MSFCSTFSSCLTLVSSAGVSRGVRQVYILFDYIVMIKIITLSYGEFHFLWTFLRYTCRLSFNQQLVPHLCSVRLIHSSQELFQEVWSLTQLLTSVPLVTCVFLFWNCLHFMKFARERVLRGWLTYVATSVAKRHCYGLFHWGGRKGGQGPPIQFFEHW